MKAIFYTKYRAPEFLQLKEVVKPISTMSQYDNVMYSGWEKDFVLVNWDQRGAGRTYGRNAPSELNEKYWIENPLTIEQMSKDGIELTKYLLIPTLHGYSCSRLFL